MSVYMLRHKPSKEWLLHTGHGARMTSDASHVHARRYTALGIAKGAMKTVATRNPRIVLAEYEVVKFSLQEVATFEVEPRLPSLVNARRRSE